MPKWFLISLIGPFLWALVNHLDKLILEKYFKKGGVGTLLIFSSVIGIFTLPVIYFFNTHIFSISIVDTIILLVCGIISAIALWLYFIALENEEASVVVVFYQLIPVFGYILSYFILGERLSLWQIVGMVLVLASSGIISFEIDEENNFKFKKKMVLMLLGSTLLYSVYYVMFKFATISENGDIWISLFWDYAGLGIFGLVLLIFFKSYRQDFRKMVKENSISVFSLNIINEIIYIVGNSVSSYALLLAPISLVLMANSYQPVFVFIIGILITLYLPKLGVESIKLKHIVQKVLALIIMLVGTYMLF